MANKELSKNSGQETMPFWGLGHLFVVLCLLITGHNLLFSGDTIVCQDGGGKSFYRLFNMNHSLIRASAAQIKIYANTHVICMAHTGIIEYYKH